MSDTRIFMGGHVDHKWATYGWVLYNWGAYNSTESGRLARLILCFR